MGQSSLSFWGRLRRQFLSAGSSSKTPRPQRSRLEFETLEDRTVPTTVTATGTLGGVAFIDASHTGVLNSKDLAAAKIQIDLTGTANGGTAVNMTTTTDADGAYTFLDVAPGTYQVVIDPSANIASNGAIAGLTVTSSQGTLQNLSSPGLAMGFISLRLCLGSTTDSDLGVQSLSAGPTVKTAIPAVSVTENAAPSMTDLAATFTDPSLGNTIVQFNTSAGAIDVELFAQQTPQTVANFIDYIQSSAFTDSIFHRLATSPDVLQGGGFTYDSSTSDINTITAGPSIKSEASATLSNTEGTIAMALSGSPANVNSATDEFYFNLGDNSASLDAQGFTVFGKIVGSQSQQTLNTLSSEPTPLTTLASPVLVSTDVFGSLPLSNFPSGTSFPTGDSGTSIPVPSNITAANFELVNGIFVANADDSLTYSVLSNTNPTLVTASISNEYLNLSFGPNQLGSATITIQATDRYGLSVTDPVQVTVSV